MAYNTNPILKDIDGNPISQYYDPITDSYKPVEGSSGGNKVTVEDNDLSLIPILDKLSQLTGTAIDEETRKSNELDRISKESTRVTAENSRVSAENTRDSNENTRKSSETARATAESDRVTTESNRVSAESGRESAEGTRVSNENTRKSNETSRVNAETTRGTNESTRQSNETARQSAEGTRSSNESTRVTKESERQSVEIVRGSNESTRQSNETARQTSESSRVTEEGKRVTAESDRASAESLRVSSENTRKSNEDTRKSQETTRETNEDLRIALYDDLLSKVASGFFKGEKGNTGNGLEYTWNGTQLGVRVEGTTEYVFVDLKGEKGDTGEIENLTGGMVTDALGYIPLSEDSLPSNLETTTGSQAKANQAETNAINHADIELAKKVDKVTGKGLSTNDYTTVEKNKLAGIQAGAQVNAVTSVSGKTGAVTVTKSDVGLSNVDNVKQTSKTEFDEHLAEFTQLKFSELSSTATNIDSEGIYQNIEWKQKDSTLYAKSTLLGTSPNYNQIKMEYYNDAGTTIIKTITWNITYDNNDFPNVRTVI